MPLEFTRENLIIFLVQLLAFFIMTIHFAMSYRFFFQYMFGSLERLKRFRENFSFFFFLDKLIRFGAILLAFFLTLLKLTKVGEQKKRRIDADFKEGGQRNLDGTINFFSLFDRFNFLAIH